MQSSHQAELEFLKIPLVAAAEFRETPLQAGGLAELEFLKICFKQAILRNSTVFKGGGEWGGISRNSCVASF